MRKLVRPTARVVVTVALLACAALLWSLIPTKLQTWAPIVVKGTAGQRVTGHNIAVTVERTLLAREVTFVSYGKPNRIPSTGVWVIAVLSYEPLTRPETPTFELRVGQRKFASNLSGFQIVQPGMPVRSAVAFDVPETPSSATLFVWNKSFDRFGYRLTAPLDSQLEIPLVLPAGEPRKTVNLDWLSG